MRSKRTDKAQHVVRLSYADRVFRAMVEIRREQKKRAIHINTLRAQVRKTAGLQQVTLGPQWTTWVGRAVTKLENQGVLQEDYASRNICLTPRAKKVLNNALRDLHTRSPSTAQEEHLWKSINAQLLAPSTPSKRRRSSARGTHSDGDDESLVNTPTSPAKRSRKRHKGTSGMNKAQLQDELKRLREVNDEVQAKLEAATRDADRDAGDIERFKAELARREAEIERVRSELDDIRNRPSTLGDATPRSDRYRSSEPPSSPTMYIGTTLQDNRFDILPPFRKRTLPASRVDDGNESDDPFRQPDAGTSPNSFLESIQRHSTGNVEVIPRPSELPTTPVSGDSEDLDQARKTISALEQQVIEKTGIARRAELDRDSMGAGATSLREQVQSLESAIIAEKLAIVGLKDHLQTTSERKDAFEAAANAKGQEIRRLEQEINGFRRQTEEHVALKENLQDEIAGLESTLAETRRKLSTAQEDASQLTTSLAMSKVTRAGLLAKIASLESSLVQHRAESTQEVLNLRSAHELSLSEKQTRVSELDSSLAVAESALAELQERLENNTVSMEDERNALRSHISSLQRSLEESDGAVRRLETSHETSRLIFQNVTKELDGKHSELDALQAQFVAETQKSAALADALEEPNGRIQRVEKEIVTVEAAKKVDEEIIRRATAGYSKLRKFHVECLAEMDGLVGSISRNMSAAEVSNMGRRASLHGAHFPTDGGEKEQSR